ncbi:hypothetical protein L198_02888 [Cryptococcus wingfieldii CBS 7118]|uniref:Uncharacterized protein n=1 Tax=Cryptococcus wingfieldii CBS 7118 TaxID=1295528 RepID=A0A1E3JI52_9TREE|nr:hypothetical protein L198_02888 [Cryptococcus wingfieldii CBS 7118]ODO00569.1 hypothetical protein L198_02888 [Cryptococcus wingfieldii CBS 7118]
MSDERKQQQSTTNTRPSSSEAMNADLRAPFAGQECAEDQTTQAPSTPPSTVDLGTAGFSTTASTGADTYWRTRESLSENMNADLGPPFAGQESAEDQSSQPSKAEKSKL